MDTTRVQKKLLLGEFKIKPVTKKSAVWQGFGIVSDLNGVEQEFVACKTCSPFVPLTQLLAKAFITS